MTMTAVEQDLLVDLQRWFARGRLSRRDFIAAAVATGMSATASVAVADAIEAPFAAAYNRRGPADSYDYVICGAGSAGCVLAGRLARDPNLRILLLEAGGGDDAPTVSGLLWHLNIGTPLLWDFVAQPEPAMNGRTPVLPMGRVVGGGSSVNAFVYARGHEADYDAWAQVTGDDRWAFRNVLPVYREMETWNGPADAAYRGSDGPLWVEPASDISPAATALRQTGEAFGLGAYEDMNAEPMRRKSAIGHPNVIVRDGRRASLARSFLHPVLSQDNVTVLTGAHVERVEFDGDRARGVEFVWRGERRRVRASRETILSLGAVKTPQVLMLSGIGDPEELGRHGIATRVKAPEVGRNLQDHPLVAGLIWEYRRPLPPMGTASQCLMVTNVGGGEAPDILAGQAQTPFASEVHARNYSLPQNGWTFVVGCASPKSRGRVELRSASASDHPAIHSGFLSDRADVVTLMRGVELARELGNAPQMAEFAKREIMPGGLTGQALETFVRDGAATFFHLSGTCRMGADDDAVVDPSLRVKGVSGLRVADTSVFPTIPRGNTMAPAALVGEQLARDLLRS